MPLYYLTNVTFRTAGSDTTAITLRAIIYYIVKNPRVHTKLINEIQDFDRRGLLSSPFVKFDESLKMPYLYVSETISSPSPSFFNNVLIDKL